MPELDGMISFVINYNRCISCQFFKEQFLLSTLCSGKFALSWDLATKFSKSHNISKSCWFPLFSPGHTETKIAGNSGTQSVLLCPRVVMKIPTISCWFPLFSPGYTETDRDKNSRKQQDSECPAVSQGTCVDSHCFLLFPTILPPETVGLFQLGCALTAVGS